MTHLIKRYGNRKLYDTERSAYIGLEDIAAMVRSGEEIQVVDTGSGEDVTAMTLTQVISEEGRKGSFSVSPEFLHDLIRVGEEAVGKKVKQIQSGVDSFVKKSMDRIVPVRKVREEMDLLRNRLNQLEDYLSQDGVAEGLADKEAVPEAKETKTKTAPKKTTRRATTAKKTTTKNRATTAKSRSTTSKSTSSKANGTAPKTTRRRTTKKVEA